ncbi:MAG: carboxymuconolactone decarboxylase family protein [Pseudomonadota bacterium]|nr:carboxymuconolactone decarboxylase family protein [Pseudomonadota bacterium]
MPLVDPLEKGSSPEVARLAAFFDETLGFTPNSVLTMQRRPVIAQAFINLNKAVMANEGRVTNEQKRLIGYLASMTAGCRYCEAHTTLAAERYGASKERLDAIWSYRESPLFTDAERAAFDFAVAAASVPNAVDAATAEALRRHWDEGEIVEILGVVALFGFLNRWNDSMATNIEEGAAEIGRRQLGRTGWSPGKHGQD